MLAVLFTQIAVAAYACPVQDPQALLEAAEMHALMPDCHGMAPDAMDAAQPQLCKAHCTQDAQNNTSSTSSDLQPDPTAAVVLVRVIEPLELLALQLEPAAWSSDQVRPPGAPPLFLTLQVLRH